MNYYTIIEFIFYKFKDLTMHNTELHKVLGFSLNQQQKEVIDLSWTYTALTRATKNVFSYAA